MTKKTPPMTAQELMAKLQADPEHIARQAKQETELAERSARLREEQKPILEDLKKAGRDVESMWDLVSSPGPYPEIIPILLKHLVLPYSDRTREALARSLAVPEPEIRNSWTLLIDEYRKAPMGWGIKDPGSTKELQLSYKDGLACALSVAVTDETLPEYISLVKDRAHGESRILLLSALRDSKNPIAKQTLEELADDPDLKIAIADWKKKQKKK